MQPVTLSDLLEIKVEGPSLANFSADQAVALWWEDCKTTRRVSQAPRKEYHPRKSSSETQTESEITSESPPVESFSFKDWDKWFGPPSPDLVEPESDTVSD